MNNPNTVNEAGEAPKKERVQLMAPVIRSPMEAMTFFNKLIILKNKMIELTSGQKLELFVVKNYFIDNYEKFSTEDARIVVQNYPKAIKHPEMAEKLIDLFNKCIRDKKPFVFTLDFTVLKKDKIGKVLPVYLTLLNEMGDRAAISQYVEKFPTIAEDTFIELGEKQSVEFIEVMLSKNPNLIFKAQGYTSAQKIEWLDKIKNIQDVKNILIYSDGRLRLMQDITIKNKVDSSVLEKILDIISNKFGAELSEAAQSGNEPDIDKIMEHYQSAIVSYPLIAEFADRKNPGLLDKVYSRVMMGGRSLHCNAAQEIFVAMIQHNNRYIGDPLRAHLFKFVERHKVLLKEPCFEVVQDVKLNCDYLEYLYKNKDYEAFRYLKFDELSETQQQMAVSGAFENIRKGHSEKDRQWPLDVLDVAPIELVEKFYKIKEKILYEEDKHKVQVLINRKQLQNALSPIGGEMEAKSVRLKI